MNHWNEGPSLCGVKQWQLPNGLILLLLPDRSRPSITVNITYLVGSRVEKRGQRGMAHFLEHMLFKGTPSFPNIPQALRERGARFNGTTWLDRTHYYETLPSSSENLEFAIQLEAERMSMTEIRDEQFVTELEVVKNELLRGENNPSRVLFQRVQSMAFARHGYGHPTIGLMDDLNQMSAEDLRDFFSMHYLPNRTVLVVAGDFDEEQAKRLVDKHFGPMEAGEDVGSAQSLLREPPQDGNREIEVQRVCEVNELISAYHIPAGGHVDFPLIQLLVHILALRPTGCLYRSLVDKGLGSRVSCTALSLHDPGLLLASVDLTQDVSIQEAEAPFLKTLEHDLQEGIAQEDLDRARNELLKRRSLEIADSAQLAIALTEPISVGDWRYYFFQQKHLESATTEELKRVCQEYLVPSNRTIGRLISGKHNVEVNIPSRSGNDLIEKASSSIKPPVDGEPFDPSPRAMEKQLSRAAQSSRFRLARLDRTTRAEQVTLLLNLRLGDEDNLIGKQAATNVLAEWMPRGTQLLDHVEFQDTLRAYRCWMQSSGFRGGCTFEGQVPRERLEDYLLLLSQVLKSPRFEEHEFNILKTAAISNYDQQITQPTSVAINALKRELAKHSIDNVRYVPSIEEKRQAMKDLRPDACITLCEDCLCGEYGELVLVGPKLDELSPDQFSWLDQWRANISPQRIVESAQQNDGGYDEIHMADKSNIALSGGMNLALRDDHEDYPAMVLGNYIFGGATLVSRLSTEVRGKRGLSYSIYSTLSAHPIDQRGRFYIGATTNPENRQELLETVKSELGRWLNDGLDDEEVSKGKAGLLASRSVSRGNDRNLTSLISTQEFAGRTMEHTATMDEKIERISKEEINEAVRRWIDPERMFYVVVGDLS